MVNFQLTNWTSKHYLSLCLTFLYWLFWLLLMQEACCYPSLWCSLSLCQFLYLPYYYFFPQHDRERCNRGVFQCLFGCLMQTETSLWVVCCFPTFCKYLVLIRSFIQGYEGRGTGMDLLTYPKPVPLGGVWGVFGGPNQINNCVIHYIYNNLYYLFNSI